MKPNWYTLAALVGVVGAIVATRLAHLDDLYSTLVAAGLPVILALMPALVQRGEEPKP